ncbi:MAG: DUF3868 domain-containing protein [Rikenellaceae bacterium]|nr:DUF3868 domain-containing protein [Rikenellaceae bacterium]
MKKYVILCCLFLGLGSACAQEIVGDLGVTRRVLAERDGQLVMELDIYVTKNAVARSQSWIILPELSTPDRKSVKLFPHVLINGPYQHRMMERKKRLCGKHVSEREPYKVIRASRKTDQRLRYEIRVPYESWMRHASLVLRQIQRSAGGEQRVFTVNVNGAVDTAK